MPRQSPLRIVCALLLGVATTTTAATAAAVASPRRLLSLAHAGPPAAACGAADGSKCCAGQAAPFCAQGLTCFYTPGTQDGGICRSVSASCGSEGSACCPPLYHTATSPPVPDSAAQLCRDPRAYCSGARGSPSFTDIPYEAGVCKMNAPSCGVFGQKCCVITSSVSTNFKCSSADGKQPGYCAALQQQGGGESGGEDADMACLQCPSAAVAASDAQKYWGCPGAR